MLLGAQEIWMHPNNGQWNERVEYKVDLDMGSMFIEEDGLTYLLTDFGQSLHSDHSHDHSDESYKAHVIRTKFIGSNWSGDVRESNKSRFYRNYLLGNDKSTWKSHLYSYSTVEMKGLYDGVDLVLDGTKGKLKYSLIVAPGVNPNVIQLEYQGQYSMHLDTEGNLHVLNEFGEIIESKPMAWTVGENGERKKDVPIEFLLIDNKIHFKLPKNYHSNDKLIIDPDITFSTFTGASDDNWGMSAAPDHNANLIGGGVVFGADYPLFNGYDATYNGGTIDVGITKFNTDGSSILYSTFIGGSGSETPNSIISSSTNELFIFGFTSSSDFPMEGNSFDDSYNNGPALSGSQSNGLNFSQGSDLYVARLSSDGANLIASTYIGGTGTDGFNLSALQFNYGDQFRGEIILDEESNVYIASTTQSDDFPLSQPFQTSLNGSQDAVVFKMPPTLNTLLWSSYFGGAGQESGNSIQISETGKVYFVGGTTSSDLPIFGGEDITYNGGVSDGYLVQISNATGTFLSGTYMGLDEYDQAYCVQLDVDNDVYVFGQTESDWAITPGKYGVPNSGQFIRKYDPSLSVIHWTTMVGAGSGHVEISPTAFLVSDCYDIYISGWGGTVNANNSQAENSSSNGFEVTADAFQSTTNGSNFYLSVLERDAQSLKYGTFMGGFLSSANHVDGGTSRFDKNGIIYHAVCAACGGDPNGFATTPGAWSETNNSANCNMACFKFELKSVDILISDPNPVVCLPDQVDFNTTTQFGNSFYWDFGDGTGSTLLSPTHLYEEPGEYYVTFYASDTLNCYLADSAELIVNVGGFQGQVIEPLDSICPGDPYQFEAFGRVSYEWFPANVLDDPYSETPIATIYETTDFTVIMYDTCGVDTVHVTLPVYTMEYALISDTSLCAGEDITLNASGGGTYSWSPPTYLNNATSANPICSATNSLMYTIDITTPGGCLIQDSVFVEVDYFPEPQMPDDLEMCLGDSRVISVSGGDSYLWYPESNISTINSPIVSVSPTQDMYYYCDFTNECGTLVDSIFCKVWVPSVVAGNDTTICPGESATLWADGAVDYTWTPYETLNSNVGTPVFAAPNESMVYYVEGVDEHGCIDYDSVIVNLFPTPYVQTSADVFAFYDDEVQISAIGNSPGVIVWSPSEFLSCVSCPNPIATPNQDYVYSVLFVDQNGCRDTSSVQIFYDPVIYAPNTFTPDGSEHNNVFKVEGGNINSFEIKIFNRWGELIFQSSDIEEGWDGTYNGTICQDGTYVWKITYTDFRDEEHSLVGHVNILR